MSAPSRQPPVLSDLGLEPHVSLVEAARLLGCAHRTLLNRATLGTLTTVLPGAKKILGRWRIPVSAIQAAYTADAATRGRQRVAQVLRAVDFPHLKKGGPR